MPVILSDSIELLNQSLSDSAECDTQQKHAEAAALLDAAIKASDGDWDPAMLRDELDQYRQLVQKVAAERERQKLRQARLNTYLVV